MTWNFQLVWLTQGHVAYIIRHYHHHYISKMNIYKYVHTYTDAQAACFICWWKLKCTRSWGWMFMCDFVEWVGVRVLLLFVRGMLGPTSGNDGIFCHPLWLVTIGAALLARCWVRESIDTISMIFMDGFKACSFFCATLNARIFFFPFSFIF